MGSFFCAITNLIFAKLKGIVSPLVLYVYFLTFCQILSPVLFYFSEDAEPITGREWYMFIWVSVFGFTANVFNVRSYQLEKASIISIVGYS